MTKEDQINAINDIIIYLETLQIERPTRRIKTTKGMATKQRILEACYEIFSEYGYAGLSIAKVAKQAGMTKGNLNYYYKTKPALLNDMYNEVLAAHAERLANILVAQRKNPRKALNNVLVYTLKESHSRYQFFLQTYSHLLNNKKIGGEIADLYNKYWDVITQMLKIIKPELHRVKTQELTLLIRGLIHGMDVLGGMYQGNEQALSALRQGLKKRIWQYIDTEATAGN